MVLVLNVPQLAIMMCNADQLKPYVDGITLATDKVTEQSASDPA